MCATPFIAYGNVYWEQQACNCANVLRGVVSASPEVSFAPEDDSKRLVTGNDSHKFNTKKIEFPKESIIASEWMGDWYLSKNPWGTSDSLDYNGMKICPKYTRQIIAVKEGNIEWTYLAGGVFTLNPSKKMATFILGQRMAGFIAWMPIMEV